MFDWINSRLNRDIEQKRYVAVEIVDQTQTKIGTVFVRNSDLAIIRNNQRTPIDSPVDLNPQPVVEEDPIEDRVKNFEETIKKTETVYQTVTRLIPDPKDFDKILVNGVEMVWYKGTPYVWNSGSSGTYSKVGIYEITKEQGKVENPISERVEKIAVKIIKGKTEENRITEESENLRRILDRVSVDKEPIGIMKRPLSILSRRIFTRYAIINNEVTTQEISSGIQVEEAFICDCQKGIVERLIPPDEIRSVAACLVQGSKTLLENGIYHLDLKPENIAYTGKGRAVHFDFGRAIDTNEPNWHKKRFDYSYNFNPKELHRFKDLEIYKEQLEKIHLFQLGTTLFFLATGRYPYEFIKNGRILSEERNSIIPSLQETGIYSTKQIRVVASMLNPNPGIRPPINIVEIFFPPSLIFHHHVQDV